MLRFNICSLANLIGQLSHVQFSVSGGNHRLSTFEIITGIPRWARTRNQHWSNGEQFCERQLDRSSLQSWLFAQAPFSETRLVFRLRWYLSEYIFLNYGKLSTVLCHHVLCDFYSSALFTNNADSDNHAVVYCRTRKILKIRFSGVGWGGNWAS